MSDVKVTGIIGFNGSLYGVSSEGHLVIFDPNAGSWVLRCEPEIKTVDMLSVVQLSPDRKGKYSNPEPVKEIKRKRSTMITPLNVAIGLVLLAILLYLFVR